MLPEISVSVSVYYMTQRLFAHIIGQNYPNATGNTNPHDQGVEREFECEKSESSNEINKNPEI